MVDPGAKLAVSDGDKTLQGLVAVELFAVAPESFKSVVSQPQKKKIRAIGAYLFSTLALKPFFVSP